MNKKNYLTENELMWLITYKLYDKELISNPYLGFIVFHSNSDYPDIEFLKRFYGNSKELECICSRNGIDCSRYYNDKKKKLEGIIVSLEDAPQLIKLIEEYENRTNT